MDSGRKSLFHTISAEVKEIGDVLEENEITNDEDIQELCYEALKDIFPGGGRRVILRSKAWKIIQASLKNEHLKPKMTSPRTSSPMTPRSSSTVTSRSSSSMTPRSSSSVTSGCSSPSVDDTSRPSSPFMPLMFETSSVRDEEIVITKSQQSLALVKEEADLNLAVSVQPVSMRKPGYTVYNDADVQISSKTGKMSGDIRNRLVRGTIHNMVSAASSHPFNRFPTHSEVEEMSKSLVVTYPCLRDSETGHGVILKQLKRRLSNTKPVKKRQGPCPKKKKTFHKESTSEESELESNQVPSSTEGKMKDDRSFISSNDGQANGDMDGKDIMDRHFNGLKREMDKKNPNENVVNFYLNKQYSARREWLMSILAEERAVKLLEVYPCFKNHVEVIEEARRVLMIGEGECQDFMRDCVKRLTEEIEFLVYYGIDSKSLNPPRSPKLNAKIVHVLKYLSTLFYGKQKTSKKQLNQEIVHQLKDHEDPDAWCGKQGGNVPVLVIKGEHCYLIVGKSILFKTDLSVLPEAVVAYVATYYLLDFDYPKHYEIGMNVLQYFIFKDINVPKDIAVSFNAQLSTYKQFKAEAE